MGARLVTVVLMRWTNLSDIEFRVLVRMAHTALDERSGAIPAATYFGGHELLAATLKSEGGKAGTLERRVRKAVTGLVAAGAVERVNRGRSGVNQVYRLTLEGAQKIGTDGSAAEVQQGPGDPVQQGPEGPTEEGPVDPDYRAPGDLPRNQEEPLEELYEERSNDLRTDLTEARASPCELHPSMIGGTREDGTAACPFCRRQARSPTKPSFTMIKGEGAA